MSSCVLRASVAAALDGQTNHTRNKGAAMNKERGICICTFTLKPDETTVRFTRNKPPSIIEYVALHASHIHASMGLLSTLLAIFLVVLPSMRCARCVSYFRLVHFHFVTYMKGGGTQLPYAAC